MPSIISGTHRPEDLIPACAALLPDGHPLKLEAHYWVHDKPRWRHEYSPMDDETAWLLEDLFTELDNLAPANLIFGAHPGDGADFGYWEITE